MFKTVVFLVTFVQNKFFIDLTFGHNVWLSLGFWLETGDVLGYLFPKVHHKAVILILWNNFDLLWRSFSGEN